MQSYRRPALSTPPGQTDLPEFLFSYFAALLRIYNEEGEGRGGTSLANSSIQATVSGFFRLANSEDIVSRLSQSRVKQFKMHKIIIIRVLHCLEKEGELISK